MTRLIPLYIFESLTRDYALLNVIKMSVANELGVSNHRAASVMTVYLIRVTA